MSAPNAAGEVPGVQVPLRRGEPDLIADGDHPKGAPTGRASGLAPQWQRRYDRSVEAAERRRSARVGNEADDRMAADGVLRAVILLIAGCVAAAGWAIRTSDVWLRILGATLSVLAAVAALGMVIGWWRSRR